MAEWVHDTLLVVDRYLLWYQDLWYLCGTRVVLVWYPCGTRVVHDHYPLLTHIERTRD